MCLIFFLFGCNLSSCSKVPLRQYHYVNIKMTWHGAQQYCREKYTDLATIESMDDINRLKADFSYSWAWIGLKDDPKSWKTLTNDTNSWRWSATGETSKTTFNNWKRNEPNRNNGNESCVQIRTGGLWSDKNCEILQPSVCYNVTEQNKKTYTLISTKKTWRSAQKYCRTHYTDLAVIENSAENSAVDSVRQLKGEAWIGLYRVPWAWADKSQSSFRHWRTSGPNNFGGDQFCIVESEGGHYWDDDECDKYYVALCHQVSKVKRVLKLVTVTDADLSSPAINNQLLLQFGAMLRNQGYTDVKLQWKIQPR
ncbi:C-type mannose receptor 2-like [Acanthochromis polyacanthus]|uniref:C-type mannose receptor 2-like n=1 Tax=Acanthochromis polyacanthus TaxID=80966 RepID=UPI0022341884|nr:C-type mannose receptor 2-like [Acanthochromis polyacanthus]